ncbi:hypothetical protein ATCC90586_010288 [Pythium insidiosum]|nr:hypothetical protein ATCC90586_010288 [Pythium insidiosum]
MAPMDYKWEAVATDSSKIEIERFLDGQKAWKKKTSQHEPCMVCPVRVQEHTMHYAIFKCDAPSCSEQAPTVTYAWFVRTRICDVSKRGFIDKRGWHASSVMDLPKTKLNLTMKRFIREKVLLKFKASRIVNAMIDARLISDDAEPFLRPSLRREFYTLCKEHLASRDGGGYITTQASRLLLKHVKAYMLKLPLLQRNLEAVTRKVLDKFPEQRIDLDVLEKYELVPRDRYAVSAT